MRYVLDTSAVLGEALPDLQSAELAISSATLAELHFGVLVTPDPQVRAERLRRLAVVEHLFSALPVDDVVARHYGRLAAAVAATGRQPRATDLLVAATAVAHEASLLTRNAGDLVGLEELVDVVEV